MTRLYGTLDNGERVPLAYATVAQLHAELAENSLTGSAMPFDGRLVTTLDGRQVIYGSIIVLDEVEE